MSVLFYVSGAVAVLAALMVVTRRNAMHALVNLIVAFLAVACVFWTLGAPFAAVLQLVVYAGAIMVLFVFAVMILNLGRDQRRARVNLLALVVPTVLAAVLLAEFVTVLVGRAPGAGEGMVGPAAVGESLFTTYALGVEIASLLLLAGLVAAFHYGVLPGRLGGVDE